MCAENVDNLFAVAFGEIDFGAETETLLGDEDGGEIATFFEDAKGFVIFVFVESSALGETVVI